MLPWQRGLGGRQLWLSCYCGPVVCTPLRTSNTNSSDTPTSTTMTLSGQDPSWSEQVCGSCSFIWVCVVRGIIWMINSRSKWSKMSYSTGDNKLIHGIDITESPMSLFIAGVWYVRKPMCILTQMLRTTCTRCPDFQSPLVWIIGCQKWCQGFIWAQPMPERILSAAAKFPLCEEGKKIKHLFNEASPSLTPERKREKREWK